MPPISGFSFAGAAMISFLMFRRLSRRHLPSLEREAGAGRRTATEEAHMDRELGSGAIAAIVAVVVVVLGLLVWRAYGSHDVSPEQQQLKQQGIQQDYMRRIPGRPAPPGAR
jgi:hypothetical protein